MAETKYPFFGRGAGWLPVAPKSLPSFAELADDIAASPAVLAEHLGVSEADVLAWASGRRVPRLVLLAMFYESKWGRSFVNCAAENDARCFGEASLWLRDERERLLRVIAHLGVIGEFGSANDPVPEPGVAHVWVSRFEQRRRLDQLPLPPLVKDGRSERPIRRRSSR